MYCTVHNFWNVCDIYTRYVGLIPYKTSVNVLYMLRLIGSSSISDFKYSKYSQPTSCAKLDIIFGFYKRNETVCIFEQCYYHLSLYRK